MQSSTVMISNIDILWQRTGSNGGGVCAGAIHEISANPVVLSFSTNCKTILTLHVDNSSSSYILGLYMTDWPLVRGVVDSSTLGHRS